jgi:PAS domain S-box-containing protein
MLERAKITEPFGYIVKPFEERELNSTIQMALYKHGMEKKLRKSEKWLSTVLNSIGDAVIVTDTKGCVLFMNPVAEKLTGWKERESTGNSFDKIFNIMDEDTREPVEDPVKKVLGKGLTTGLENHTILVARDGNKIPIDYNGAPIKDDKGATTGVVLVFHDITNRRKIEEEIRKSKVEWEMTFDNANELILLIDKELNITRCNKSFAEFANKPFQDIIGRQYTDFIPYDPEQLKKKNPIFRTEIKTGNGQWLYSSYYHIKNKKDEFLHTIIIATNITDLKKTQQKLIVSEEELKNRIKDLENFYEMAIGRELKMKELKTRISELAKMLSLEKAKKQG